MARLDKECEAMRAEIEDLRQRLSWAEDNAERWRDDALEAINREAEATGGTPGLTMDGRLVVCAPIEDPVSAPMAVAAQEQSARPMVISALATRVRTGDIRPGFQEAALAACLDAPSQFPRGGALYWDGYDTGYFGSRECSGWFLGGAVA